MAAGAAVGAMGLSAVASASPTEAADVPQWPWPYKKLDPEWVGEKGHIGYQKGACCYGAYWALTSELGHPYTMVPAEAFKWGEAGVTGWGSHCGALIGASAVIGMVHGATETTTKLINDLTEWYAKEWGSGSPLCHISVTEWAKANGQQAEGPSRSWRCSMLTKAVAKQTAILLNTAAEGEYKGTFKLSDTNEGCLGCHGPKGTVEVRNVKQGCLPCHDDAHKS